MYQNLTPNHTIKKIKIIDANYVFVDGISRSGKNSLLPIISSFSKVEHFKDRSAYESYVDMYVSGNLTKQGFNFLYAHDLLLDVWFTMMGRDLNTNAHDLTSIMNSSKKEEYLKRLERRDTSDMFQEIVKEVKKRQLIFPFVSEVLRGGNLLSEISKNFKYIIVMRNPIDLVFTWFRSGRGTRLGTDQRYLKPAFQFKEFDNLHYSMLDNAKEFNKANPLEKCFLVIEKQMIKYLDSDLLHSNNSCLVPFENYYIETGKYVKKFEKFLGTSKSKFTSDEMLKANLPRKKEINIFSTKANMIFDNMNEKYKHRLMNLSERYETEISDVYKLDKIIKYPKGKFKGLSIDAFSKVSAGSKYHKGKRSTNK